VSAGRGLTWAVAAGSLAAGFGVAEATGVRALGGVVLAAGLAWCAWRWWAVGPATAAGLIALYVAAFAASHMLGDVLGAWGAVAAVAAVVALAAWLTADRPPARHAAATRGRRQRRRA